jgi:hypothetical protein
VLEAILAYWHTLAYILVGVLEKIRRKVFNFLWTRDKENDGIPWVKWTYLAKPREEGRRGLKNIHFFGEDCKKCVEIDL